MIGEYNKFIGGSDVFDEVRKKTEYDVQHMTKRYTVRMFEVLWSMCLSQAYNVYCHVNRNRTKKQMGPIDFKIAVIRGLISHEVVVDNTAPETDDTRHIMKQSAPCSRGDGTNRRKVGDCRFCPNSTISAAGKRIRLIRNTTYYCSKCKIYLHPKCFTAWHDKNGDDCVPSKQHRDV